MKVSWRAAGMVRPLKCDGRELCCKGSRRVTLHGRFRNRSSWIFWGLNYSARSDSSLLWGVRALAAGFDLASDIDPKAEPMTYGGGSISVQTVNRA